MEKNLKITSTYGGTNENGSQPTDLCFEKLLDNETHKLPDIPWLAQDA